MTEGTKNLSDRQKQYIWLMGSFPDKVAKQGRGHRSKKLHYAIDGETLYIFGYSSPFMWLVNRGLVRKLQNPRLHKLTDEGQQVFNRLLMSGAGMHLNAIVREAKVKPAKEYDL